MMPTPTPIELAAMLRVIARRRNALLARRAERRRLSRERLLNYLDGMTLAAFLVVTVVLAVFLSGGLR